MCGVRRRGARRRAGVRGVRRLRAVRVVGHGGWCGDGRAGRDVHLDLGLRGGCGGTGNEEGAAEDDALEAHRQRSETQSHRPTTTRGEGARSERAMSS
jgi:hypothetical protein